MKNLINLTINPFQFYRDFKEKEEVKLTLPLILIVITGLITVFVGYRTSTSMTMPAVEGVDMAMDTRMILIGAVIGGITAMIGTAISWLIRTAILNFVFKKLGGKGNFKRSLYITGTAAFTGIFILILSIIFPPKIDAAALQESLTFLGVIKDYFNLFVLWELFLLIVGFAIDNELSYKKAAIPVFVFYLVIVAISIGMAVGMQGFYSQMLGGMTVEP